MANGEQATVDTTAGGLPVYEPATCDGCGIGGVIVVDVGAGGAHGSHLACSVCAASDEARQANAEDAEALARLADAAAYFGCEPWCSDCHQHPDLCTRCTDCDACAPPREHYTDTALCAKHRPSVPSHLSRDERHPARAL